MGESKFKTAEELEIGDVVIKDNNGYLRELVVVYVGFVGKTTLVLSDPNYPIFEYLAVPYDANYYTSLKGKFDIYFSKEFCYHIQELALNLP